jgi:hypothetical protein
MPNHCNNTLGVLGKTSDVEKFVEFVKSKNKDKTGCEYEIFESLIPMPKELEGTTSPSKSSNEELIKKYGTDNWYDWCNNNWGTKWGDYDITKSDPANLVQYSYPFKEDGEEDYVNPIENTDNSYVHFYYDTAWAPGSDQLCDALCLKFPELNFNLYYEEPGMGFAGQVKIKKGEVIYNDSWDFHPSCSDISEMDFDN